MAKTVWNLTEEEIPCFWLQWPAIRADWMICSLFVTSRATLAGAMTFADQRWAPKKGKQRLSWPTSQWVKTSRSGTSCFSGARLRKVDGFCGSRNHPSSSNTPFLRPRDISAKGSWHALKLRDTRPKFRTHVMDLAKQLKRLRLLKAKRFVLTPFFPGSEWMEKLRTHLLIGYSIYQIISLHSDLECQHSFCRGTPMLNKWEIQSSSAGNIEGWALVTP